MSVQITRVFSCQMNPRGDTVFLVVNYSRGIDVLSKRKYPKEIVWNLNNNKNKNYYNILYENNTRAKKARVFWNSSHF